MLTVEKYLELRNKASESADSLPELVDLINCAFYRDLQLAYDDGWNDGVDSEQRRQLAIAGEKK